VMEVSQVKKELIHLKSWPFSRFQLHGRNFKEVSKDEVDKKVALATTPILPVVSLPDALLRTRCTALSEDLQNGINGAALQRSGIASSSRSRQGVYWCLARMPCLAEMRGIVSTSHSDMSFYPSRSINRVPWDPQQAGMLPVSCSPSNDMKPVLTFMWKTSWREYGLFRNLRRLSVLNIYTCSDRYMFS
jgi:hypothetical protein